MAFLFYGASGAAEDVKAEVRDPLKHIFFNILLALFERFWKDTKADVRYPPKHLVVCDYLLLLSLSVRGLGSSPATNPRGDGPIQHTVSPDWFDPSVQPT